jgi:hypothetical protein
MLNEPRLILHWEPRIGRILRIWLGLLLHFLTAKYAKGRERRLGLTLHFLTTENTEYTEVLGLMHGGSDRWAVISAWDVHSRIIKLGTDHCTRITNDSPAWDDDRSEANGT